MPSGRDLLDTHDPKDEMPAIQITSLRPLKARAQLIKTEKSEMLQYNRGRVRYHNLIF